MKPLMLMLAICCHFAAYAQVLRPTVTAAAGTTQVATAGNGVLSFTVGETAITTLNQSGVSYGQGFHNAVARTLVATEDLDLEAWKLRIFPNPTSQSLSIEFSQPSKGAQLQVSILNLLGQPLSKPVVLEKQGLQTLDVGLFPPGIYLLQLKDLSGRIGSIRFVKI